LLRPAPAEQPDRRYARSTAGLDVIGLLEREAKSLGMSVVTVEKCPR
jgi:hypothetical protein